MAGLQPRAYNSALESCSSKRCRLATRDPLPISRQALVVPVPSLAKWSNRVATRRGTLRSTASRLNASHGMPDNLLRAGGCAWRMQHVMRCPDSSSCTCTADGRADDSCKGASRALAMPVRFACVQRGERHALVVAGFARGELMRWSVVSAAQAGDRCGRALSS
jgi:hypothetical protein